MLKSKKILTGFMSLVMATSSFGMSAVFAEKDEFTAYLAYSDTTNTNYNWSVNDESPEIVVSENGTYTVSYTSPVELTSDVKFLGVKAINLSSSDVVLSTIAMNVGGEEVDISEMKNEYDSSLNQLSVIENYENTANVDALVGATQISITFEVTGMSEEPDQEQPEVEESSSEVKEEESNEGKSFFNTDPSVPTLGFDSDDWTKFISIIDSTKSNAFSLKKETKDIYQGASVKLVADVKKTIEYTDDSEIEMGILLEAKNFGIENFDGYTFSTFVRFNSEMDQKLYNNGISILGKNSDNEVTTKVVREIEMSTLSNVDVYSREFINIPEKSNTTKIVIKVPVNVVYSGDVIYLDNITLISSETDEDGNALQINTLDTYNKNATAADTDGAIKQKEKENTLDKDTSSKVDDEKSNSTMIIVIVAVIAVVIGIVGFVIIKNKKRFY